MVVKGNENTRVGGLKHAFDWRYMLSQFRAALALFMCLTLLHNSCLAMKGEDDPQFRRGSVVTTVPPTEAAPLWPPSSMNINGQVHEGAPKGLSQSVLSGLTGEGDRVSTATTMTRYTYEEDPVWPVSNEVEEKLNTHLLKELNKEDPKVSWSRVKRLIYGVGANSVPEIFVGYAGVACGVTTSLIMFNFGMNFFLPITGEPISAAALGSISAVPMMLINVKLTKDKFLVIKRGIGKFFGCGNAEEKSLFRSQVRLATFARVASNVLEVVLAATYANNYLYLTDFFYRPLVGAASYPLTAIATFTKLVTGWWSLTEVRESLLRVLSDERNRSIISTAPTSDRFGRSQRVYLIRERLEITKRMIEAQTDAQVETWLDEYMMTQVDRESISEESGQAEPEFLDALGGVVQGAAKSAGPSERKPAVAEYYGYLGATIGLVSCYAVKPIAVASITGVMGWFGVGEGSAYILAETASWAAWATLASLSVPPTREVIGNIYASHPILPCFNGEKYTQYLRKASKVNLGIQTILCLITAFSVSPRYQVAVEYVNTSSYSLKGFVLAATAIGAFCLDYTFMRNFVNTNLRGKKVENTPKQKLLKLLANLSAELDNFSDGAIDVLYTGFVQ